MAPKKKPFWTKTSFWSGAKNYIQFSKRMAFAVTAFWMVYRIINFVVIIIRPESAQTLVDLVDGIDKAMIANMGWYTGNSSVEKAVYAFAATKKEKDDDEDDKDEEDPTEEENG